MEQRGVRRVADSLPSVLSAPWSARTWRLVLHVLLGLPVGLLTCAVLLVLGGLTAGLAVTWVFALPLLAALFRCSRGLVGLQRARFAALLGVDLVLEKPAAPPAEGGWARRVLAEARASATWRWLGYHALAGAGGVLGAALLLGLWAAGLAMATVYLDTTGLGRGLPYTMGLHQVLLVVLTVAGIAVLQLSLSVARGVAQLDLALARQLLGPSQRDRANQLSERVVTLTEARAKVVEAADSERRRLERDLHDGVQQQLVSLSMNLGITRRKIKDMPEPAREALAQAHEQTKQTLADLRQLVRGLHPAVLDDLGLDAALSGIAARSPVPARLRVDLPQRPSGTIEAAAYFVVSEALANVAKHSGASEVAVSVEQIEDPARGEIIKVTVTDNGCGGASEKAGSGLRGLVQRVGGVDGTLHIDSPVGGPTVITAELPCGS
ncbi:sensor histidine kinase [Kitasatospora sp. NPDC015120]|uniref:sensor histidine kinase n=1 Tax=Kitasatospora sp. NPDC015120 TaxID=3364023 RepID=UPI0036F45BB6